MEDKTAERIRRTALRMMGKTFSADMLDAIDAAEILRRIKLSEDEVAAVSALIRAFSEVAAGYSYGSLFLAALLTTAEAGARVHELLAGFCETCSSRCPAYEAMVDREALPGLKLLPARDAEKAREAAAASDPIQKLSALLPGVKFVHLSVVDKDENDDPEQ